VAVEVSGQLGPLAAQEVANALSPSVALAAFLLALAAAWVFSAAAALWKHFGFRLIREGDRLVTEEGLTTRRRIEIPVGKVQLLRSDEPMVRRAMGFSTLLIETAGLGIVEGQVRQSEGFVPMVERERLNELSHHAVPQADVDAWNVALNPAHPRALYRACIRNLVRSVLAATIIGTMFHPWGWLSLLAIPLTLPLSWMDWRAQGWLVTPTTIVTRRGVLTRQTWVLARDKLQSIHLAQSPVMRWHGLGVLVVRVAGSQVALPDVAFDQAQNLLRELAPS
jgi:putative membrane protein